MLAATGLNGRTLSTATRRLPSNFGRRIGYPGGVEAAQERAKDFTTPDMRAGFAVAR